MSFKSFKIAAVAAFLGLVGFSASSSFAGSTIKSGDTIDGWTISFPTGIGLVADDSSGSTLKLEKFAVFTTPAEGLVISFVQHGSTAAPKIAILDETVVNGTGTDWNGFQMFLVSPLAPPLTAANFETPAFSNIAPFTTSSVSADTYNLGGGTIADGSVWQPGEPDGLTDGGTLTIDAHPSTGRLPQAFFFKELPVTAAIPLPAAAWSGLSGLLGLGLLANAKKLKGILA